MAFISKGVTNKWLVGKLETRNVETISKLFSLEDNCAWESKAQTRVERCGILEEPDSLEHGKPTPWCFWLFVPVPNPI